MCQRHTFLGVGGRGSGVRNMALLSLGFFVLLVWEDYIWRHLFSEFYGI